MSAIVGAIALETSVDRALKWLDEKLTAEIDRVLDDPIQDPQTVLQNQVQKDSVELPEYVVEVVGNSRPRSYVARVWVEGRVLGTGLGNTIKDARRVAASVALERL
jgi:dsRNA-specific ribonuclease